MTSPSGPSGPSGRSGPAGNAPAWREQLNDRITHQVGDVLTTLRNWPWFDTLRTLRVRFREDRLGQTASSLTFTTLIALVPLVTVMLAVFSAFPIFASFQGALQKYFLQSLVPQNIAVPVLGWLTEFASKASSLGALGLLLLVATALALVLTIDRTLNAIWRVRKTRSLAQRILVYWAAMTLGPLALGVSLSVTSYALSANRGLVASLPGGVSLLLSTLEFGLLALAAAALYRYVPNALVRWRYAWAGAIFVALAFEAAKAALGWYVKSVPTYSVMYGAFATAPILLLWIYLVWVIVLLGAVIAAYAPSLQAGVVRRAPTPGFRFEIALTILKHLAALRDTPRRGLSLAALARQMRADALQLEPVIEALAAIDWVQTLEEPAGTDGPRLVLLCDPAHTNVAALADALLVPPSDVTAEFRSQAQFERITLAQALGV